jgi:hypothetical protein
MSETETHEATNWRSVSVQQKFWSWRRAKLSLIEGAGGQISPSAFEKQIGSLDRSAKGDVLALTRSTESGTIYRLDDLRGLSETIQTGWRTRSMRRIFGSCAGPMARSAWSHTSAEIERLAEVVCANT